eukprot:403353061
MNMQQQEALAQAIYGCNQCIETVAGSSDNFVQCTSCADGLYLLANSTYNAAVFPTTYSFCVPDCRMAHPSYVNDPTSRKCQWCGEYCQACNLKYGCESCQGEQQQKGWVNGMPTGVVTYSTFQQCQALWTTPGGVVMGDCWLYEKNSTLNCKYCDDSFYLCLGCRTNAGTPYNSCENYVGSGCIEALGSNVCSVCDYGYSLMINGAAKTCQKCVLSNPYYAEAVRCQQTYIGPSNLQGQWKGCRDGYVDQTTFKCVQNCGVGSYGVATFNARASIDTSVCVACSANCLECGGSGTNNCLTCKFGFYLEVTSDSVTRGQCKSKSGTLTDVLYVATVTNLNPQPSSQHTGAYNKPFNSIQDAITAAYELGAPKLSADVTIILKTGEHAMVRYFPSDIYMPLAYDPYSQTTKITIETENGAQQRVNYKLRDNWKFKVGAGLTIKNIYFEAIDSLIDYQLDQNNLQKCTTNYTKYCCSINSAGILSGSASCVTIKKPQQTFYQCQLINLDLKCVYCLKGSKFSNFIYELNSFIEFNDYGGNVQITNTVFDNINTCGSLIRNKRLLYFRTMSNTTAPLNYQERANNYQYELYNKIYSFPLGFDPFSTACTNIAGSTTPCYSLNIDISTFQNFGFLKQSQQYATWVDPSYKLQYYGSIIDFDNFLGPISITGCTFQKNILKYDNCDAANYMNTNQNLLTDKYPSYGTKSKVQIRSLISIVNYQDYKFDLIENQFYNNTGTKGIIYLDFKPRTSQGSVLIASNQFSMNAGYLDSNVIFIRARATSIYAQIPSSGNLFCTGYHFESNTFYRNFGCSNFAGGLINFECVETLQTDAFANGRYAFSTINQIITAPQYYNIDFTTHTTNTLTSSYNGISYITDLNKNEFLYNIYSQNYYTHDMGLINIKGSPRNFFMGETFIKNGEMAKEVTNLYGTGILSSGTNDKLFTSEINNALFDTSLLSAALIKIERTSQVSVTNTTFDGNWQMEPKYSTNRAQLLYFSEFYGEFIFDNNIVQNQVGMNNAQLTTVWNIALTSALSIQKQGSVLPLFKFQATDLVKFTDHLTTGSQFTNLSYYQDASNSDSNMFFDISATGYEYDADQLTINDVIFTNVNCLQCTRSPYQIRSGLILFYNLTMTNINYNAYILNLKSVTPFFKFNLRKPYYDLSSNLLTETLTFDKVNINKVYSGIDGRFMDINYENFGSYVDPPTTDQITLKDSQFTDIKSDGNGGFAQINVDTIKMQITGTNFTNIASGFNLNNPSFGGVFNVISLGSLDISNSIAKDFISQQTTTANGGGRFIYMNQAKPFSTTITSSTFICSTLPYILSTIQSQVTSFVYNQGSCFHLNTQASDLNFITTSSIYQNCYTSERSAAIYLITTSAVKVLDMFNNTVKGNAALYGGSIFCELCTFNLVQNTFQNNVALNGGDLFIKNTLNQIIFDSHTHLNSKAYNYGGSIYYQDTRYPSPVIIDFSLLTGTQSLYQGIITQINGGLLYLDIQDSITLNLKDTQFYDITATQAGGMVYISNTMIGALDFELNACDINGIQALSGNGGVVYLPSSATTSIVTVSQSSSFNTSASSQGGSYYLGALTQNDVLIEDSTIDTSKSGSDGGVFYMGGIISNLKFDTNSIIKNSRSIGKGGVAFIGGTTADIQVLGSTSISNSISNSDGGVFYSVITGSNTLLIDSSSIIGSTSLLGSGGVVYFSGAGNSINVQASSLIQSSKAQVNGGVFYTQETAGGNFVLNIQDSTLQTQQSSTGNGGVIYDIGSTICDYNFLVSTISNSYAGQKGGQVYSSCVTSSTLNQDSSTVTNTSSTNEGGLGYFLTINNYINIFNGSSLTTLSAQGNGGLVSSQVSNAAHYNLNGAIITSSHSNTYGGVFSCKGGIIADFQVYNSTYITDSYSLQGGGTFYSECDNSTVNMIASTIDTSKTGGSGGVAQLKGLNNFVTLNDADLLNGQSTGNGAGFSLQGTLENVVDILNTSSFTNFQATANGGFLNLLGLNQTISIDDSQFSISTSQAQGGIIYSSTTSDLLTLTVTNSIFDQVQSKTLGSFISLEGDSAAALTFIATNNTFSCQALSIWDPWPSNYLSIIAKLDANLNTIGGLMYFENGVTGTVASNLNTFDKCYTTSNGAVFYIPKDLIVNDTSSNFYQNAGLKGQIYCDSCDATFFNTTFTDQLARDASVLYINDKGNVIFDQCAMNHGRSRNNGGGIVAAGTGQASVIFQNCQSELSYFESKNDGGFLQIDNSQLNFGSNNCTWNHLYAGGVGGFTNGAQITAMSVSNCMLVNITSGSAGSFLSSTTAGLSFNISNCIIKCAAVFNQSKALSELGTNTITTGSLFYIAHAALIVSNSNIFSNCFTSNAGAIFNIQNSTFMDINSTYETNAALQGGVFYMNDVVATFQDTQFINNYGNQGGSLYATGNTQVTFTNTTVQGTNSLQKGGFLYAYDSNGTQDIEIIVASNTQINNAQSTSDGGSFYLDGDFVKFTMQANTFVQGSKSTTGKGGLMYVNRAESVEITGAQLIDISSASSGSVIYSIAETDFLLQSSLFQCKLFPYVTNEPNLSNEVSQIGGAFYFKDSLLITSISSQVKNCYLGDYGGVYYLENTVLIDSGASIYSYNAALYGGAVYCTNCTLNLTNSQFTNHQGFNGGLIYLKESITVNLDNIKATYTYAANNGGLIYAIESTSPTVANINFLNTIIFSTAYAKMNGGSFYIDHQPLQLKLDSNIQMQNSYSTSGHGGVFYLARLDKISIIGSSVNSFYKNFYVSKDKLGSFMYSVANNVTIELEKVVFSCKLSIYNYILDLKDYLEPLIPANQESSAFYIQDALSVTSTSNTYQYCYQMKEGAIFHLLTTATQPNMLLFTEKSSIYQYNQASYGGAIYCLYCNIDIQNQTQFKYNYAREGGAIYIKDASPFILGNSSFQSNTAMSKGGVISFYQNLGSTYSQVNVSIQDCQFYDQAAVGEGQGGAFYLSSQHIEVFNLIAVEMIGSYSSEQGGIVYIDVLNGTLNILNSNFTNFSAPSTGQGSMIYSVATDTLLIMQNNNIQCRPAIDNTAIQYALGNLTSKHSGAVYFKNSIKGLYSTSNTFMFCFECDEGSAFNIENSQLIERYSNFKYNQALNGGVIKCLNSQIDIKYSYMLGNRADAGGAFVFENECQVVIDESNFDQNNAVSQGGIISVSSTATGTITPTTILIKNCDQFNGANAEIGGIFYVNHPAITIVVENVKMDGTTASKSGGIAYISQAKVFNITNSEATNFKAPETTFLYSQSSNIKINIISSVVTCNTNYAPLEAYEQVLGNNLTYDAENTIYITGSGTVYSFQNVYSKCGILNEGAVFRLSGNIRLDDYKSVFFDNSAIYGGVISCTGGQVYLMKTKLYENFAFKAGVVKLDSQGYLNAQYCEFKKNNATAIGGVIVALTDSWFDLIASDFLNNYANQSSVIDALGSSLIIDLTIQFCTFEENTAYQNTISLNTARAVINMTQFENNVAQDKSKNIFLGFATVYVYKCTFKSPFENKRLNLVDKATTSGSFFNIILDVQLTIEQTVFVNGISYQGGAIFISGFSTIVIKKSQFLNNVAKIGGGAIYANGFKSITISDQSRLMNNIALQYGDDFYLSNSEYTCTIQDTVIENPNATTSVYASGIQLRIIQTDFVNIQSNSNSEKGAAIQCLDCRSMIVNGSTFSQLRSQIGGAIYVQDVSLNKRITDKQTKYSIINSKFNDVTAYAGGAIYLSYPQYFYIENTHFDNCRALNATVSKAGSNVGSGGAIFYECGSSDSQCQLNITGNSKFTNNFAQKKGGAIHWNYYEPIFGPNVTFKANEAGWYGDSLSSYAQQLMFLTQSEYDKQLEKVAFGENNQRTLYQKRELQSIGITNASNSYVMSNVRSGGQIPYFYLAHVDKYGQIVGDDDTSKLRVQVDSSSYEKNRDTLTYTPVLEGSQSFLTFAGVSAIQDLTFTAAPGYKYRLSFTSSGIDDSLPENKKFMKTNQITAIDYNFFVKLRECIVGEYFTQVGKCIYCEANVGFSLIKMTSPGDCEECPVERAYCEGGANLGPRPGYWRRTNSSSNFIKCMNPSACLGWFPLDLTTYQPLGQCADGYQGILCAQCKAGYSSTGNFQCGKCPGMAQNIIIMMLIIIGVGLMFVMMVRSTLAGALEKKNAVSIYMKILMNHFQLILLVSSFNFSWPEQVEKFFSSSQPVAEASTQIFSIDCFMADQGNGEDDSNKFRTFFLKLLAFALLPVILASSSALFWLIHKSLKQTKFQKGKAISTLVITLFLVHPSIVQYMFDDFNCKNIDGESRIYKDLQTVCWSSLHTFWSYFVAMPSIVVWGLGIPAFAFVLLTRERKKLGTLEIREKLGFLYNGYKHDFYYWEIVIMYRKIILIFIAVFIQNYGVMVQALIVFLLLIICLILNLKTKPFFLVELNDLETLSLLTSIMSVYCGIYFVANVPDEYQKDIPQEVKGGIDLGSQTEMFFFAVILISNLLFFMYWVLKFLVEVKVMLIKKFEKVYLILFLCFDRELLEKHKIQQKIDEENQLLRDQYMKLLSSLKKLQNDGKIVLTQQLLERCQAYLQEEKFMEQIGLVKNRLVDEKEIQRHERQLHGNKVRELEFKKQYSQSYKDLKKQEGKGAVPKLIDATKQLDIDDEFVEAGGLRQDFIDLAEKIEYENKKKRKDQSSDLNSFHNTMTSNQFNTQQSLMDRDLRTTLYDEQEHTLDDLDNVPLSLNLRTKSAEVGINKNPRVKKPLNHNLQANSAINLNKQDQSDDSNSSQEDRDIWEENGRKVQKNNYLKNTDKNLEFKKYLQDGEIEKHRKQRNFMRNKGKMHEKAEEYIDKSKISRGKRQKEDNNTQNINQASRSNSKTIQIKPLMHQPQSQTTGQQINPSSLSDALDQNNSSSFQNNNQSNIPKTDYQSNSDLINADKIERELAREVCTDDEHFEGDNQKD